MVQHPNCAMTSHWGHRPPNAAARSGRAVHRPPGDGGFPKEQIQQTMALTCFLTIEYEGFPLNTHIDPWRFLWDLITQDADTKW